MVRARRRRRRGDGRVTEAGVWTSAHLLVDRHGRDAAARAARLAAERDAAGDDEGRAAWLRVRAAVDEILHGIGPEDFVTH